MAARRPQGSDPKAGVTSPEARVPAYSDRLSQLGNDVAEIRNDTVKEVFEELRRLSYDIEEINKRFDTVDRTGDTLEELRVRVYHHHENNMTNLKRQVERGSAPLPPQNQQAGTDRFPIPMYSGERSSLSMFLRLLNTWALSHKAEGALSYSRPVIMTSKKSRSELEIEYGWRNVEQSLVVWSALTKVVEKDTTIANIVVGAKASSEAWRILSSMVENDSSDKARELAKKQFEDLSMSDAESVKEYIARAKSLALNIKYHDIEVTEQEISRRVMNGLPPSYAPENINFALKKNQSSRAGGWSCSRGGAQQELGRDRRQPCPGRWCQNPKRRAERGTWRPQWRRTRQARR